jgi:hypothetical protein
MRNNSGVTRARQRTNPRKCFQTSRRGNELSFSFPFNVASFSLARQDIHWSLLTVLKACVLIVASRAILRSPLSVSSQNSLCFFRIESRISDGTILLKNAWIAKLGPPRGDRRFSVWLPVFEGFAFALATNHTSRPFGGVCENRDQKKMSQEKG